MGWFGTKWVYSTNRERLGPFSAQEIRELIENGVITPETILSEYRVDRDYLTTNDYPAIKTEFSVYFPREDFVAATKDARVTDYWLWAGVFAPLIFTAILYYIYLMGLEMPRIALGGVVFGAIFMALDAVLMNQKGYKPPMRSIIFSLFFLPMVYFYYRSRQLWRGQTSTWMSAVCLLVVVSVIVSWPFLSSRYVEEFGMRTFNAILQPLRPEITAECVSASVQRLPGMKFDVVGHLSDGQEMRMAFMQSWQSLTAYSVDGEVNFSLPLDIGAVFMKRHMERHEGTVALEAERAGESPGPAVAADPPAQTGVTDGPTDPGEQNRLGIRFYREGNYPAAVEWYRKAADQRYAYAQNNLGWMYLNGYGVERDYRQAIVWFRKAAEQGNASAQISLGWVYETGSGVERDLRRAVEWYRGAAEQGDARAQTNLGRMYVNGRGVRRNDSYAVEWFRRAAEQGYADAQSRLGWMYVNERGVERNYWQAIEWYRRGAEQGHAVSQFRLGRMYANGRGIERNYNQAAVWYRRAAEQGHAYAQTDLGVMYANGRGVERNNRRAVEWYRRAAEQGNARAQRNLGLMYANGRGVRRNDNNAVQWYRRAAEQGHALGQFNLGGMYEAGRGVERNYVRAVEWFRRGAEQRHAASQFRLGRMYANGRGVERNYRQAVEWYRRAAERGHASGQFNLGSMYENGLGVVRDEAQALEWFRRAAERGNRDAEEAVRRLSI